MRYAQARHSSSPHPLRCRKSCPYGQSGTGRLTFSVPLRPPNLRPFQTRSARVYSSGVETSVFLRFSPKAGRLDPFIPHSPGGAITDSAPKVIMRTSSLECKHPINDVYQDCYGVATFASNTKSHDDKGRGRSGDCLLRREQDQLQTAPVGTWD